MDTKVSRASRSEPDGVHDSQGARVKSLVLPAALAGLVILLAGCHPRPRDLRPEDGDAESASTAVSAPPPASGEPAPGAADDGWGCGLPPELRARGWPKMLPALRAGGPPPVAQGGFSILVLPDTQYYVACRSAHLGHQVAYALEQAEAQNIQLVLTVGDLTEHNSDTEWAFFRQAVAPLFERIPLILTTGNHDHGVEGSAEVRGSGLLRAFGPEPPPKSRALLAELPRDGNWENAYYRLPLGKSTLGVLTLEWSPRKATVDFAESVLDRYPSDRVIFSTHAYLYHDDTRYDWERFGLSQEWNPRAYGTARRDPARDSGEGNWNPDGAFDGEMLWRELLEPRSSVWLTLNGHVLVDGQGYLASRGRASNLVHQMLVNFQMLADGGSGFLRLLQVDPSGKTLRVFTYSPSLKQSASGPTEQFELTLDPPLAL